MGLILCCEHWMLVQAWNVMMIARIRVETVKLPPCPLPITPLIVQMADRCWTDSSQGPWYGHQRCRMTFEVQATYKNSVVQVLA